MLIKDKPDFDILAAKREISSGKTDVVIKNLKEILNHYPDFIDGWIVLGEAYFKKGSYTDAITCYDQILRHQPQNTLLWYNKGLAYSNLREYQKALGCFEKSLKLYSKFKAGEKAIAGTKELMDVENSKIKQILEFEKINQKISSKSDLVKELGFSIDDANYFLMKLSEPVQISPLEHPKLKDAAEKIYREQKEITMYDLIVKLNYYFLDALKIIRILIDENLIKETDRFSKRALQTQSTSPLPSLVSSKRIRRDSMTHFSEIDPDLKKIKRDKPWLTGIIDNLLVARAMFETKEIETKNRIALILTDEALELGFKKYIIKVKKFELPERGSKFRENLQKIVKKHTNFSEDDWQRIEHFYSLRCDLYHEEGEKTITDGDFQNYYDTVLNILKTLFSLTDLEFNEKLGLNVKRMVEIIIPANFTSHIRGKSSKANKIKSIDNKFFEAQIDSTIPLNIRVFRFTELYQDVKAGYYNLRQFLSVLLPFYHKLKASSDDLEDIFFQILTIKELFKDEDAKTLILKFWEEENINNVFLENISSNASNRDIQTKLKHQLEIILSLYAKDLSSLERILQGLIERCNELYFNHLCDHCEFERISTGLFANLKDFLLNLSKSPNYNEIQTNWILQLYQKFK